MNKGLLEPWRSIRLFSEHYIEKHFLESDKYKSLKPPEELRTAITQLYENVKNTIHKKNESQLEDTFIRPVLKALGIHYIVQVSIPGVGSPDYAFFVDEASRDAADERNERRYTGAIAIADAKRWGREFDSRSTSIDDNPNAVPTRQIANYIGQTGIDWGVLTDGRCWRLYHKRSYTNNHPVSESYFEFDLIEALDDPDLFHLFYAVFSGAAFAEESQSFILNESKNYWAEIGESLKGRAYEALTQICNGFYKYNPENSINDIYEASVILLYRLLFVLHAENRELLPINNTEYRMFSLKEQLKQIENIRIANLSDKRGKFYVHLKELFDLINEGDEKLNLYQYNGGLFKDNGLPFLPADFFRQNVVPDCYMVEALKLIAFVKEKNENRPKQVDYSELDVRHLGSIYEGLLEFHPELKNDVIVLYNDKGERKATGSYYTPNYIVNYIVENTLGPLTAGMSSPNEVLTLKILDPSMGSGHFLVGAIDYIGEKCIELAGEESEVSEKDFQRIAVEKCIYGVDLNPLAVELAKLSLWLHTIAVNKPLSFLDLHLKLGNSLVGANIKDLGELPKDKQKGSKAQTNFFEIRLEEMMPKVLEEVMGIITRETTSYNDIEAKEVSLRVAEEHLSPFRAVADTWIATYFDLTVSIDEYAEILNSIRSPQELLNNPLVLNAAEISHGDEHRVGSEFFHWELEFPEIFFDENGREKDIQGFDAVIGNPPYVDVKVDKYYENFTCAKSTNLYAYMIERSVSMLKENGLLGMIVPLSLVCSSRMRRVREFLQIKNSNTLTATFAKRPASVFPQVQQRTTIILSKRSNDEFVHNSTKYNRWYSGNETEMMAKLEFVESSEYIQDFGWPKIGDEIEKRILSKLFTKADCIKSHISGDFEFYYHGIGMYWLKAYTFRPIFKDADGTLRESTNLKVLSAENDVIRNIIIGLLNSSLFFFYWTVYSDDFHLLKSEIERFPLEIDFDKYGEVYKMLSVKVDQLMQSYQDNSFLRHAKIQSKKVIWQEFKPAFSKSIIDEIDVLLSMLYSLDDEETEYIKRYDEKFRLGDTD